MATIDLSNYDGALFQATSNAFTDGNAYFDPTSTGTLEFSDATDTATFNSAHATGTIDIDVDSGAGTFIRIGSGSFTADGFRAGHAFVGSGFVSGGNNASFVIASITTTTIANDTITVVTSTGMVTETGASSEVLTCEVQSNTLVKLDGLKFEAMYALENRERRFDETLRAYDRWTGGTFKFGGAYKFINGRAPANAGTRGLVRGSGWNEETGVAVNRIYFGTKGLGVILATSFPSYQTNQYLASTDFPKGGNIDEAVQVFGDVSNGSFNNTLNPMYMSIRTYGKNYDRIDTFGTLGIAELGGYSTGAALNESDHLTTIPATYPLASALADNSIAGTSQTLEFTATTVVLNNAAAADNDWAALGYGVGSSFVITGSTTAGNNTTYTISALAADTTDPGDTVTTTVAPTLAEVGTGTQTINNVQVTPFTGMSLEAFAAGQDQVGVFAGATSGEFSWILNNTLAGSLDQCVAYLDAITQQDAIVTTGTQSYNGKDYDEWYEYTPGGKIRPITGANDGEGVFIANLPLGDRTRIEFVTDTSNGGLTRLYPVSTSVTVEIGQAAINDTQAWFHIYNSTNYNTGSATEYLDAADVVVSGDADNTSSYINGANTFIEFSHDFTGDGSSDVIMLCEGDGGVTQAKTAFTIADQTVSASCVPGTETNV
jgi:hypothetical protein